MSIARTFPFVGLMLAVASQEAHADCLGSPPALLWSLPAPDETDVPANAKLWFLTPAFSGELVIEIDGRRAQTTDVPQMFDPGAMDPGEHILDVSIIDDAGDVVPLQSFTFTSDATLVAPPAEAPHIAGIERGSDRQLSATCQAAVAAIDCFDQGQDTHFVVDTPPAAGFLLTASSRERGPFQHALWPGDCAQPEAFLSGDGPDVCIELSTISFAGVSSSRRRCEGDACSQSGAPPAFVALAFLLLALRRRA